MIYKETKTMNAQVAEHAKRGSASMPSAIAERVRKIGGVTIHSIGQIARLQRIVDNDQEFVAAQHMLAELCDDKPQLAVRLRSAHSLCGEYGDVATESLIENWIDEAERRVWFLYEATRPGLES